MSAAHRIVELIAELKLQLCEVPPSLAGAPRAVSGDGGGGDGGGGGGGEDADVDMTAGAAAGHQ